MHTCQKNRHTHKRDLLSLAYLTPASPVHLRSRSHTHQLCGNLQINRPPTPTTPGGCRLAQPVLHGVRLAREACCQSPAGRMHLPTKPTGQHRHMAPPHNRNQGVPHRNTHTTSTDTPAHTHTHTHTQKHTTHTRAHKQKHTHSPGTAYGTCRTRVRKQGGSSSTAPPPANADQPETARHLIEHCLVLKSRVINVSSSCNRSFSAKSRKARQANLCTPTLPPTPTLTPTRTELPAATRAAGEDGRHVRAVHMVANHDRVYRATCSKRRPLITRQAHASCRKQLRPVAAYPTLAIGIVTTAKGLAEIANISFML